MMLLVSGEILGVARRTISSDSQRLSLRTTAAQNVPSDFSFLVRADAAAVTFG
jgi:hypothetical protein